ncbi:MAG: hydroxymethylglutaryl-CoA lyase [Chloroflexi bacterium]|nr:hydroxymethylglutaryl-CoA lyase [Chloroflexota bacterium]
MLNPQSKIQNPKSKILSGLPRRVTVVEVGPRDGLQNERTPVSTEAKVRFIDALSSAGLAVVEATSFVHPKAVPQLADAEAVLGAITRRPGTRYPSLVPNPRGLERALRAGAREIAVFTAASESFNRRNINRTIDESFRDIAAVMEQARPAGLWVRGYVSTAFGCPYEGEVPAARAMEVAERLLDLGVDEVSIGDTIGVATPRQVEVVLGALLQRLPARRLGLHFHDTRGTALANTLIALQMGISVFDASAGGLGGCPYAPGAAGNLATEDLLYMLHGMGIETGVDLDQVAAASRAILAELGRPPSSKYLQVGGCYGFEV